MKGRAQEFFRPSRFILIMGVLIWGTFYVIPESTYFEIFKSRKIDGFSENIYMLLIIFLVAVFSFIGEKIGGRQGDRVNQQRQEKSNEVGARIPRWWIVGGLLISVAAYLIWFSVGVLRAGGPVELYQYFKGNAFFVKETLLKPISGITSFTQLAVIAIPLTIMNGRMRRTEKILILFLILLAALRSFLYSERLALLEVVIPSLVVSAVKSRISLSRAFYSSLAFLILVITFFIVNEANRSFAARGISSVGDIVSSGIYRFFGYYLTSVNNYGLAYEAYPLKFPFYFTLLPIWSLPGLDSLYSSLTGIASFDAPKLLYFNRLNPELNVFTTPGYWVMEFGIAGGAVVSTIYGFISGLLFSNSRRSPYWLAFYSVWFVGILEFMRIYYFGSPRVFIPVGFFLITLLLFRPKLRNKELIYEYSG